MIRIDHESVKPYARKYIWWKPPEQAVKHHLRVIAQVMDIGDYPDVQRLIHPAGEAAFEATLRHAEAGQFQPRSWAYWHYRLGLAQPGRVRPLPQRRIGPA